MDTFTRLQLAFLRGQRIGRLATVDGSGAPQNNPVGFFLTDDGDVLVGGHGLEATRKFRNVRRNAHVALVVDELASVQPWVARGVEIRGDADALTDVEPPMPWMSRAVIRIHPRRIIDWGLEAVQQAG